MRWLRSHLVLILGLLYVTFRDVLDALLVFLAVVGALAGAVMFQSAFGFNFSVVVWIGYVATFGMATQTGVIMLVYLREAVDYGHSRQHGVVLIVVFMHAISADQEQIFKRVSEGT